ncbi:hypothetical protein BDN67DRAFT_1016714 [Paxillus ammoniavirescens]|nr:hypothetical protein BDN67DRAFT_1016714 [Paxillus ammoniavirescens]
MATRHRADTVHNPGSKTVSPGSEPPSVRLEGERNKATSLNIELTKVKTVDDNVEEDQDDQKPPRDSVGTPDGDDRRPNELTEPPDEDEGARGGNSEVTDESSRVDEPKGKGDEGADKRAESREVEGEVRDKVKGNDGHRDGRTNDTGRPDVTKHIPGPHTPHPSDTTRPTHLTNPPRHRGRLKSTPTNVSQHKRAEYTHHIIRSYRQPPQLNRMRRKQYRTTGGVSQSHQT